MTQNQSGKQLFEWVKGFPINPVESELYHVIIDGHKRVICFMNSRWLDEDAQTVEGYKIQHLSPAQPSTGKQLPKDEEIDLRAKEDYDYNGKYKGEIYPYNEVVDFERLAFEEGAKWMRERAQGESDKWIRVEDGNDKTEKNK